MLRWIQPSLASLSAIALLRYAMLEDPLLDHTTSNVLDTRQILETLREINPGWYCTTTLPMETRRQ